MVIVLHEIEGAAVPRWDVYRNQKCIGSVEQGAHRVKHTTKGTWLAICTYGGASSANCNSLLEGARIVLAARRRHAARSALRRRARLEAKRGDDNG